MPTPLKQWFDTPDTVLAATICYHGYLLDHCEQQPNGYIAFYFKNDKSIAKLLLKYAEGKVAVEPRRWYSHYKAVRERMRNYVSSPQAQPGNNEYKRNGYWS